MLHTVHTVLHIMYSFVFYIVDSVKLSKHQKQGHTKIIFVKDFQCKIERYIPLYKIGLPMRCLALLP